MTDRKDPPPRYSTPAVERAILEIVANMHPEHLDDDELAQLVVTDSDDEREMSTFARGLRKLTEFDLIRAGSDDAVEPTPALLRIVSLFGIP